MAQDLPRVSANVVVPKPSLQKVFDNLRASGFSLIGPTVRDGAVVLDEISGIEDLPLGWTAEQGPGRYRLKQTRHQEYFGYGVAPQSWKRFLHLPQLKLFSVEKTDGKWVFKPAQETIPLRAFIGVRACELSAIAHPGSRFSQWGIPGSPLRAPAGADFHPGGQLRAGVLHLFLQLR